MRPPYGRWEGEWSSALVASAIHAGHGLDPATAGNVTLAPADRLREEDPLTDVVCRAVSNSTVVLETSRFEIDVNRPRELARYSAPEHCWGLQVRRGPDPAADQRALELYDTFYGELGRRLDELAKHGAFIFVDVHSYNHRRSGPDQVAADEESHPEINLGTRHVPARFTPVVDAFSAALAAQHVAGRSLDVRSNVRFFGGNMSRWIHHRYPTRACVLSVELKKTFMDEWTGRVDLPHLLELARAVAEASVVAQGLIETPGQHHG